MVIKQWLEKNLVKVKKYQYVLIVLFIGLLLLILPERNKTVTQTEQTTKSENLTIEIIEERISKILSKVDGAGKVEVILTVAAGEETIYQTDVDYSEGDNAFSDRRNTVTITNSERTQSGLIKQINPASYQGAIIVCKGADDPAVCLKLINAVSNITGLRTNCISILKSK